MISLQPPLSLSLVEIDLSPTKLTTNANDQKNKKQKKTNSELRRPGEESIKRNGEN